jgi:hypothetical protein
MPDRLNLEELSGSNIAEPLSERWSNALRGGELGIVVHWVQ